MLVLISFQPSLSVAAIPCFPFIFEISLLAIIITDGGTVLLKAPLESGNSSSNVSKAGKFLMSRATEAFSRDSSHENFNANKIWLIKVWRICGHSSNIQNFFLSMFPSIW